MRNTKQKSLILEIINNSDSHPSAESIYNECKKIIPNISLGTVYRNLNQLVDLNVIQRIKMKNNIDRYDRLDEHVHFICIKCNRIIDIYEKANINFKQLIGNNKILNCKISFEGICEECQNKGE